jgi:hypothetical protein
MKTKELVRQLQEEVELLRTALQMHVSIPTPAVEVTLTVSSTQPEKDYHSPEALQELMQRMEERDVTYAELRKIFSDDLDTLCGWLNSFSYLGALNGCQLDQDDLPEDKWVWDGCFEKRGEELWYTGGAGACGYGHAELLVKDDDLIVVF